MTIAPDTSATETFSPLRKRSLLKIYLFSILPHIAQTATAGAAIWRDMVSHARLGARQTRLRAGST